MLDFRITTRDLQAAGLCVRGTMRWCRDQGLDHRRFLKEGVMASELANIDDAFVKKVIEKVGARHGQQK